MCPRQLRYGRTIYDGGGGKKINDSRREMTEGTNLGKRNKRCRYKKHIIELRAVEVRHFLKKWNLKFNKDKFVATTDIM
jgi:hypothetical protein